MKASAECISMNNVTALKNEKTAVLHETVLQVNALMGQGLYLSFSHLLLLLLLVLLVLDSWCLFNWSLFSGYHIPQVRLTFPKTLVGKPLVIADAGFFF